MSKPVPGQPAREPKARMEARQARQPRQERQALPAQRVQLVYQHLLATASDREHRAALRLLPRFGCLGLRESYIAAIAAARRRPAITERG